MGRDSMIIHYGGHEFMYSNFREPTIGDYVLCDKGYVLRWDNNTTNTKKIILIKTN